MAKAVHISYMVFNSQVGALGLIWTAKGELWKIVRIVLPNENIKAVIRSYHRNAVKQNSRGIDKIRRQILRFLSGEPVEFSLDILDWSQVNDFQKKVLLLESRIPRGYISTYGRLAKKAGVPKAARAVGQALAHNPYPIIIPCHRTVKSDGSLGGYRGGAELKKRLLKTEGRNFDISGKVLMDKIWY